MKNMHNYWFKTVCGILFLFVAGLGQIKADSHPLFISGNVRDAFTEIGLSKAKVILMSVDSIPLDTVEVRDWYPNNSAKDTYFQFKVKADKTVYILKAVLSGYQSAYLRVTAQRKGRNQYLNVPPFLLKKKRKTEKNARLQEVVVQATKIKMVYKGDTLIYNADAFNMPEGSMLSGLIKQLPGAEINTEGEIRINGRKIDYLTLNGKKLFNGNNKMLIDNLPYYTVKNVKVFEEIKENDKAVNQFNREKDYVMNVVLKKEYDVRSFGNADVGIGTEKRHQAHLFTVLNRDKLILTNFFGTGLD